MNENINMRIVRYFADKYPHLSNFIYKCFAEEIRKLNLQDFVFKQVINQEEIKNRLKCFNLDTLSKLHQLSKSEKSQADFKKETLAIIFAFCIKQDF
ncbi:hypothetical protein [Helicobacter turcicus]|uniref:Uncharacterized protein n=1 Tax=Helicobacter turcicus TaxID=2867412 RepID=A0ABS7JPC3_9HELI|nr:hypothetical protein [Helicobacter turcicus]MBX7491264.1 hypothetical protein [Helicobacter turcicus]MBX7546097.1 hypothetical protein [Helicobacter turcicus]